MKGVSGMAMPQMVQKEQLREISCRDFFRQHVGPLQRKGRRTWGNCPFHKEKTDSLVVDERRFHCFGCGADGDIFEMAKRIWNCGFFEVVQRLASEYGITPDGREITVRIRPTAIDEEEQFNRVFDALFKTRQAFKGFLKRYKNIDEIPERLVIDLGTVDGIMAEMVADDPARNLGGYNDGRMVLKGWQML